jgi:hypothetical protein
VEESSNTYPFTEMPTDTQVQCSGLRFVRFSFRIFDERHIVKEGYPPANASMGLVCALSSADVRDQYSGLRELPGDTNYPEKPSGRDCV